MIELAGRAAAFFAGRTPLIRQGTLAECGLACLAMIAGRHGYRVDLNTLRIRHQVSLKGMNARQLLALADRLALDGRAVRLDVAALRHLALPAILHWDLDHFVVLDRVLGKAAIILDPGAGRRKLPLATVSRHFTGVAVELRPRAEFRRGDERRRIGLASLWSRVIGLKRCLAQILLLSLILQGLGILAPLQMQLVIDQAILKSDADLLLILFLGFTGLGLFAALLAYLRRMIALQAGQAMTLGLVANVFRHLLALPIRWFESRHVGDIVSRFNSTGAIQRFILGNMVGALLDGVMAAVTLAILLFYSPLLFAVVLAGIAGNALIAAATLGLYRLLLEDRLVAAAREDSTFLETIRAAATIKLGNRESERFAVWQNRFVEAMNADRRYEAVDATIALVSGLAGAVIGGGLTYLAARMVMASAMTLGMIVSFMAYQAYFSGAMAGLVRLLLDWRMLAVHLDRLADIVLEKPEAEAAPGRTLEAPIAGAITLERVTFRYHPDEPPILEEVTLEVKPGEIVAITGPSGGGKTTLLKLMLGILPPPSGEIRIDRQPLARLAAGGFRRQSAAILQEDQLLSGSIAENIAFFDGDLDMARIEEAARLACVDEDVAAMPMSYASLVGDMGSTLSGGQKQRIMIARALYRRPRILFMDEGTAHLDLAVERRIHDNLRALAMTRLIVAHRPDTLRIADRVLVVAGRSVREARPTEAPALQISSG